MRRYLAKNLPSLFTSGKWIEQNQSCIFANPLTESTYFMEQKVDSLTSEALVAFYYKTNSAFNKNILGGSSLKEPQDRIQTLSQISEKLTRRRIQVEDLFNKTHPAP